MGSEFALQIHLSLHGATECLGVTEQFVTLLFVISRHIQLVPVYDGSQFLGNLVCFVLSQAHTKYMILRFIKELAHSRICQRSLADAPAFHRMPHSLEEPRLFTHHFPVNGNLSVRTYVHRRRFLRTQPIVPGLIFLIFSCCHIVKVLLMNFSVVSGWCLPVPMFSRSAGNHG